VSLAASFNSSSAGTTASSRPVIQIGQRAGPTPWRGLGRRGLFSLFSLFSHLRACRIGASTRPLFCA
jgi:hypothetical protein